MDKNLHPNDDDDGHATQLMVVVLLALTDMERIRKDFATSKKVYLNEQREDCFLSAFGQAFCAFLHKTLHVVINLRGEEFAICIQAQSPAVQS